MMFSFASCGMTNASYDDYSTLGLGIGFSYDRIPWVPEPPDHPTYLIIKALVSRVTIELKFGKEIYCSIKRASLPPCPSYKMAGGALAPAPPLQRS